MLNVVIVCVLMPVLYIWIGPQTPEVRSPSLDWEETESTITDPSEGRVGGAPAFGAGLPSPHPYQGSLGSTPRRRDSGISPSDGRHHHGVWCTSAHLLIARIHRSCISFTTRDRW